MEDSLPAEACIAPASAGVMLSLFDDLVRCETRLYNALNDRLRSAHGIVTSQFESLRYLHNHPGCRVAELAAYFAIGVGATSKGVDRLEAQGWVRRTRNPTDRRSSLLELAPAGTDLVTAAEATVTAGLADLVGTIWDDSRRAEVGAALGTLRKALEHSRAGLPAG